MKIAGLGHSAFWFELTPSRRPPVRILVDPWFADFSAGDLMARFPRIRFAPDALRGIDGIFLSHAHTDHFDPESLVALRKSLDPFPAILLPASLLHLAPLLAEHLGDPEIRPLMPDEPVDFHGVRLEGFFNPGSPGSNEDDVMVLTARAGDAALVAESDAVLDYDDPELRGRLSDLLADPDLSAAALLTTRNQLDATMSMLAAVDAADREARLSRCFERTFEEISPLFPEDGPDEGDLFANPRLVRFVGGQGLAAPPEYAALNRTLFPIRVADRVRLERETARRTGAACRIEELVPGAIHALEEGGLRREPAPGVRLLDEEAARKFDPRSTVFRPFAVAPLRDEPRNVAAQAARIEAYLRDRFRPWLAGARRPPLEHLLAEGGGEWRIRIRYGTTAAPADRDYVLSYAGPFFVEGDPAGTPHEHVFANDVEDVFDGRADEFSPFVRAPLPAPAQHLWESLGLPWLNPDFVERKLAFHFGRARAGETNESFARPFWPPPE